MYNKRNDNNSNNADDYKYNNGNNVTRLIV